MFYRIYTTTALFHEETLVQLYTKATYMNLYRAECTMIGRALEAGRTQPFDHYIRSQSSQTKN